MDNKKIIETFKSNPKHDEYWVTTDGNAFTSEQRAESHSFNLEKKDRKIQHITRAEALKDGNAEAKAKAAADKAEADKAKKEAEAKAKAEKQNKPAEKKEAASKPDEAKSDEKQATDQK